MLIRYGHEAHNQRNRSRLDEARLGHARPHSVPTQSEESAPGDSRAKRSHTDDSRAPHARLDYHEA